MFDTVLVANRGEIAVRIFRTLRHLGIRSVAVFSDVDRGALHVREADLAVRIGPTPARDSYLNIERILAAARESGAEAIHPGYGFMAESAAFARACAASGVVFIGPSPEAIDLMGDKIRAKNRVAEAGVPVVPGVAESGLSDDQLLRHATEIGFPILVKPSAGGGGKGMRRVDTPDELPEALAGARREARASFGDDTLFLERLVGQPRHFEVQILADSHGRTLHLGERECTLQRRHQKVVEEAPSPLLDATTRAALGALAVEAARSVRYVGAGTVEFITGAEMPGTFYFMEMNTRLQVEHPVTEMITGIDLVEQQIRIAAGEPLSLVEPVSYVGHAVEARLYAEDPTRNFLPTGGRILALQVPSGEGVRVDTSMVEGLDVASSYDPMLAKIVAWGPDRPTALARLRGALHRTAVLGVKTNLAFLESLVGHPDVIAGRLDTGLIERELELLVRRTPPEFACAAFALSRLVDAWPDEGAASPWDLPSGWRAIGRRPLTFHIDTDESTHSLAIVGSPDAAEISIDGRPWIPGSAERVGGGLLVSVDGITQMVLVADDGDTRWLFHDGTTSTFRERARERRGVAAGTAEREIRSPMPGRVIELKVQDGEQVRAGQPMMVIEAMKMEHQLNAPHDGIAEVHVRVNDSVAIDEVVATVSPLVGDPQVEVLVTGNQRDIDTKEET